MEAQPEHGVNVAQNPREGVLVLGNRRIAVLVMLLWGCTPPSSEPVGPSPVGTETSTQTTEPLDVGHTRTINDRDYLPAALLAIGAAQDRIRVAEYLMYADDSVTQILWALRQARLRGVQIQLLVDQTGDQTQSVIDQWVDDEIEVRFDSRQVTLHNKLILADDVTLVGSHNFTGAALDRNHEGAILLNDAEVTAWYADWFDTVWDDPEPNPQPAPWTRTDVVPLADRSITGALVDCLEGATDEVDLLMYAVAWDDAYPGSEVDQVLTALEAAHTRGVAVSVVLDGSDWITSNGINDAAINRLSAAGVEVWLAPANVTTHAKVLRCDQTVVVGDANWSYSGLALMHGTSAVLRDPVLSESYRSWIAEVRSESQVPALDTSL